MTATMSKVARREVDPSEHTLALLEIIKERRQKENKLEKVGIVILNLFLFFENFFSKSWFIGWQWRWRRRKEMKVLLFLPKRNKIKWQLIATRKHGCNKILKVDHIALNQIPCEHDDQCLSLSMERLSFVTTKWITAWSDTQHYGAPPATNIQTLTLLYIVDIIIIISSIIKVTHHRHNHMVWHGTAGANILSC